MQVLFELTETLKEQATCITLLTELARKKQGVMGDVTQLGRILVEEQKILVRFEELEAKRQELHDVIGQGVPFSTWLEGRGKTQEEEDDLVDIVNRVGQGIMELKELNEQNTVLINESLAFVQFSLNMLANEQPVTYAKEGTKPSTRKSFIDRKV